MPNDVIIPFPADWDPAQKTLAERSRSRVTDYFDSIAVRKTKGCEIFEKISVVLDDWIETTVISCRVMDVQIDGSQIRLDCLLELSGEHRITKTRQTEFIHRHIVGCKATRGWRFSLCDG